MKILIGCEVSGKVRDALDRRGHDAWSCDLKYNTGKHFQCDVRKVLHLGWDMAFFFPDCTNITASGLHWNCRTPGRAALTWEAIKFVEMLWECGIPKIVIENPIGCLPTFSKLMTPAQIIQPYDFGHDASKATCLWTRGGIPLLKPTKYIPPRIITIKGKQYERWGNQTDSGQNKLAPSDTRAADRAETYDGIAEAMADQMVGCATAEERLINSMI